MLQKGSLMLMLYLVHDNYIQVSKYYCNSSGLLVCTTICNVM